VCGLRKLADHEVWRALRIPRLTSVDEPLGAVESGLGKLRLGTATSPTSSPVICFLGGITRQITTRLGFAGAFVATYLGRQLGWYHLDQGAGFIGDTQASSGATICFLNLYRLSQPARLNARRIACRPADLALNITGGAWRVWWRYSP
jgi:hypothetical protein